MEKDSSESTIAAAWVNFCQLTEGEDALQDLCAASQIIHYRNTATLMEQATHSDLIYLVIHGQLKVVIYTINGHEIWLSNIGPGEIIGEISALTGMKRTSSVIAVESSVLLKIPSHKFMQIVEAHGAVSQAVARLLAHRLAATSAQMSELVVMPVTARLHAELIRMGTRNETDDECYDLLPDVTVSELGQRIHATRESTSRALTQLEHRGLVNRKPEAWTVILPRI